MQFNESQNLNGIKRHQNYLYPAQRTLRETAKSDDNGAYFGRQALGQLYRKLMFACLPTYLLTFFSIAWALATETWNRCYNPSPSWTG